jgi:hypothetical protein
MFCTPGHIFGDTEGVGSRFHVLRSRTHFRRDRGRGVPFSCFVFPNSFSEVPRASGPFSCFARPDSFSAVPRAWVPFSCFALPDSFSAVSRAPFFMFAHPDSFSVVPRSWGPVFIFCASGLIFGGTEGVASRFYVLRARTRFRRYRGRQVSFSCFVGPESFSAVPRASGAVFMFYAPRYVFQRCRVRRVAFSCFAPGLVFGYTEGVESHFHVLRSRTRFRRCRVRRVPFSYFALPDSFSAVPRE